jgi:disulfide bond formation protein DsbB
VQDILERQRTEARQALRSNPNAWQQARPRAATMRAPRPARMSLGEVLQRLLEQGAACNAWRLFGVAVLAWALALLCTAWLLGVFP